MNELLRSIGPDHVVGFVLVLARLSPLFLFAPLFSSKMVPMRVRGIVCVALAIGLSPMAIAGQSVPLDALSITELVLKEILVGLAFSFSVGLVMAALQVAGTMLDTLIGFSFGATIDPVSGNQGTVVSQLYGLVGVMVFIAINGDALVLRGFAHTFDLVGVVDMPAMGPLLQGAVHAFTGLFAASLQVAAPVLLALVLTDAAFGLVTRVVPTLNVFSVGLPVKVLLGLLMVGASLPFVANWIGDQLQGSVETALGTIGVR